MNTENLPSEVVVKIFSNLELEDVFKCRLVCRQWEELIKAFHLQACCFYRQCHPFAYAPSLKNPTKGYQLSIRNSLKGFSDEGEQLVKQLDKFLQHRHFPEIMFFSKTKLLIKTKAFIFDDTATIQHSDWVRSASFSPDGHHLVTASFDKTAQIWGLFDGQWQEKATIQHSDWVSCASFSPDGHHLVTVSNDNITKIWRLKCEAILSQ